MVVSLRTDLATQIGDIRMVVSQSLSVASFRVMVQRACGAVGLVQVCGTLSAANHVAQRACASHQRWLDSDRQSVLGDPERPRFVFVQAWHGSFVDGQWEVVNENQGGFRFRFDERPKRSVVAVCDGSRFVSGKAILCVLLSEKTKRGGWKARIVGAPHEGPITNSRDVPTTCEPGAQVTLFLSSLSRSTGQAQFAWCG